MEKNLARAVLLTGVPADDLIKLVPLLGTNAAWSYTERHAILKIIREAEANPILLWQSRIERLMERYRGTQVCTMLGCKSRTMLYRWRRGESIPGKPFQLAFGVIVRELPDVADGVRIRTLRGLDPNEKRRWKNYDRPFLFADGQIRWYAFSSTPETGTMLTVAEYIGHRGRREEVRAQMKKTSKAISQAKREAAERRKVWNASEKTKSECSEGERRAGKQSPSEGRTPVKRRTRRDQTIGPSIRKY